MFCDISCAAHLHFANEPGFTREDNEEYVLVEGTAYAFTDDDDGNELIVASFAKGDAFGELNLLDQQSRTTNVITTSACQCLVVPAYPHV